MPLSTIIIGYLAQISTSRTKHLQKTRFFCWLILLQKRCFEDILEKRIPFWIRVIIDLLDVVARFILIIQVEIETGSIYLQYHEWSMIIINILHHIVNY